MSGDTSPHVGWLMTAAEDMRKRAQHGWANTCEDAAREIVTLQKRAVEAEGILSHNMALANATARGAMDERNSIIRKMRELYTAIEIAEMAGLTRQRVHQILNEAPIVAAETGASNE